MIRKLLHYLPRVLTVLAVAFLYIFVLEAFSPEFGWQSGLMHFVLATVVLLFGILAWKKPLIGGWFFLLPLIASLFLGRGGINFVFVGFFAIGSLYLFEGYMKKIGKI